MIDIKIHEDTVSTVNEFLENNEQYGDDWSEQKKGLNELLAEVKRLRKTLACIAFSPDDPKWVGEKLDDLAVDSDTWIRWME